MEPISRSPAMIGRCGLQALMGWASQVGITANISIQDERGWDVLLQLPAQTELASSGPLDRAPPEIGCMVQVKTTTTEEQSFPISLSNWRRMVREPWPWFVLAVHIDSRNQPTRAYLVHIDEQWCSRVLKRLREYDARGIKEINQHQMDVSWSESDRLSELHGQILIERIHAAVRPDPHGYFQQKICWFQELGYDENSKRVQITFQAPNEQTFWEEIADIGIGLRTYFSGEWRAKMSDIRFEIEGVLGEFGRETGEMEYNAPSQGPIEFEIFSNSTGRHASFACESYRSACLFPFIPLEYDRCRFASRNFECILGRIRENGYGASLKIRLEPDILVTLGELESVAETAYLLAEQKDHPIGIRIGGNDVSKLVDGLANSKIDNLRDEFRYISQAIKVCESFFVSKSELVKPGQLYLQRDMIAVISSVLVEKKLGNLQAGCRNDVPIGEFFGTLVAWTLQLYDKTLIVVVAFRGEVSKSTKKDDYYWIEVDDASAIDEKFVIDNDNLPKFNIREVFDRQKERLQALGCHSIRSHGEERSRQ